MIDSSNDTMPMPRNEFRKMTGYNDFTTYSGFKFIGRGGSGSVYSVIRDDTRYAMKIPLQFNPNDDGTIGPVSEEIRKEFEKEADRLNNLSNKCSDSVVTMEDWGTVPFPWIVMEYAAEDLRTAIDKGTVSIRDLIGILHRLDRIHGSGFIHLDIKPENIMRVGAIWKFTDFGLSNPINSVSVSLSKKAFAGTIQYSAPEQISEKKYGCRDHRTDIWQMAVICYEVLARRKPYDSDDLLEVSDLIRDGGPDLQQVPEEYRSVLSKAFRINKDDRYQHAIDLADALEKCSNGCSLMDDVKDYEGPNEDTDDDPPEKIPEDMNDKFTLAMNGDADAQYDIGFMYYYGNGVEQSYSEALKWLSKAAEQGHAGAQNSLGYMYNNGHGVEQSDIEAVKWYRMAAEQGNAKAQNNLGWMYNKGRGVEQSDIEAVKWYRMAAEQGNANGQVNLGYMYNDGKGVKQSYSEAVKWYRKAAEQGNEIGQSNLGYMYDKGLGVEQSYTEALNWYEKAADQGNESAIKRIAKLEKKGYHSDKPSTLIDNNSQKRESQDIPKPSPLQNGYLIIENGTCWIDKKYKSPLEPVLVIPQGVKTVGLIGAGIFGTRKGLEKVYIPDSVKTIEKNAFQNCHSLQSLSMPDSIRMIGSYAFSFCKSLKTITIPDSVAIIGSSAFWGCASLESVIIPNTLRKIESSTFSECSSLKSVSIPDSVEEIGSNAFGKCTSLQSITIPASVSRIDKNAFKGCTSLKTIYVIGDKLTDFKWVPPGASVKG